MKIYRGANATRKLPTVPCLWEPSEWHTLLKVLACSGQTVIFLGCVTANV